MNKIVNCSDAADASIEVSLELLKVIKVALTEKRGASSQIRRVFLSLIYIAGLIVCIYLAFMYDEITLESFDARLGHVVIIVAGFSSAIFLAVLLLSNLIENRYYKTIFKGEQKVNHIINHLQKTKKMCNVYYDWLDGSNKSMNNTIELGEDFDVAVEIIKQQIASLEKKKLKIIGEVLSLIYYVAAISVGTLLVLLTRTAVVLPLIALIKNNTWADLFYGLSVLSAIIGIAVGPFALKYYFEEIKLIPLRDSLIFLIVGSGFAGFIAALIVAILIFLIIGLVYSIISAILSAIAVIIGLAIIIAIVVGLINGG